MKELLKKNRRLVNKELKGIEKRKYFSPSLLSQYKKLVPVLNKYAKGVVIDVGCGDAPYLDIVKNNISQYDTFDVEERDVKVTYLGDIQNMEKVPDNKYDTVLNFDVLEHVKEPRKAISEMCRVLKNGGKIIISVPHLSRLHEVPNDYYRFTQYGLKYLLEKEGFEILLLESTGGLFSFIGHQISSIIILPLWHIQYLKKIILFINKWLFVLPAYYLDKIFDRDKLFALGYIVVGKK